MFGDAPPPELANLTIATALTPSLFTRVLSGIQEVDIADGQMAQVRFCTQVLINHVEIHLGDKLYVDSAKPTQAAREDLRSACALPKKRGRGASSSAGSESLPKEFVSADGVAEEFGKNEASVVAADVDSNPKKRGRANRPKPSAGKS